MKWVGVLLVGTFLGIGAFLFYRTDGDLSKAYLQSPCETPISYSIGLIDSRFGLDKKSAEGDINEAAALWSKNFGKNLFVYDPSSKAQLKISFVYDQRQELDTQIRRLESSLDSQNLELQNKIEQYKKDVADFRAKMDAFNEDIKSWNEKGGAPIETYNNLIEQQANFKKQSEELNNRARDLNLSTEDYNSQVGTLNKDVSNLKQALNQKPEEGLYDPNQDTITIYFVNNHDELVHTLAHELGHALGIQHVSNNLSIMYPNTTSSIALTQSDLDELTKACKKEFILDLWRNKFAKFIRKNFINHDQN